MRLIVTEGCGFIGYALVLHLVQDLCHEATTADTLANVANPASLALLASDRRQRPVEADIRDAARMRSVVAEARPPTR